MRHFRLLPMLVLAVGLSAGCDIVNDALPPLSVGGGVFGLNGSTGKELTAVFGPASKDLLAATAHFQLNDTFDDADAGDFSEISELISTIGVAVQAGNVGLRLDNDGSGSYPASVIATSFRLDFSISDAGHSGASALGPPPFGAAIVRTATVTFNREAGCTNASAQCDYLVAVGNIPVLQSLFPVESVDADYLNQLSEIVFISGDDSNTVNTLDLSLFVDVTANMADYAGLTARLFVAEYDTQVTPVIF